MKRRSVLALLFVLVVILAGVALAVPASPFHLPRWLKLPAQYNDHPASYWMSELNSPEKEARREAAKSLGHIGSLAEESIPALTKAMTEDDDRGTRIEASFALTKMDPNSPTLATAVPALTQALADKDLRVRMNAAMTLNKLGPASQPAVSALIQAVQDKANDTNNGMFFVTVQEMAAMALGKASAGTAEGVPALRELLAGAKTSDGRQARIRALGYVGPEARPALPELRAFLKNVDAQVVTAAEDAIKSIERGPGG